MTGILSYLGIFINFIQMISNHLQNEEVKEELYKYIETPLNNAIRSYDNVFDSLCTVSGAMVIGLTVEPDNQKEKAKEIAENLNRSLSEFESDFKDLMKVIEIHRDSFKSIMNRKDWIYMEEMIESSKSEDLLHDITQLFDNKAIYEKICQKQKSNKFPKSLNKNLGLVLKKYKINMGPLTDYQALTQDPIFQNQMVQLFIKYSNNPLHLTINPRKKEDS